MRVKIEQLPASLQKGLAPVYLLSGEEPLQLGEAADAVRLAAKQADYLTREVLNPEQGNEWQELTEAAESLSIFSDKKLIDLRLPSAKPGPEGTEVLLHYCNRLPENTLLLITTGKLDAKTQKSLWFQALEKCGVFVQVWPLQGADLLHWLEHRAKRYGMRIDQDAVQSLAARIEGNLLAAAQEIEKLYVLHGGARINKTMIEDEVANSSHFDIFNFSDELLAGNLNRVVGILNNLKAEGIAAPIILWAMSREARTLFNLKAALKQGLPPDAVYKKYHIWDKRKINVQQAMKRLKTTDLFAILQLCAQADRQIKGQAAGDAWESLIAICLQFTKSSETNLAKDLFYNYKN